MSILICGMEMPEMRMGGYAIHELPLKNPTIPVIIPAEEGE